MVRRKVTLHRRPECVLRVATFVIRTLFPAGGNRLVMTCTRADPLYFDGLTSEMNLLLVMLREILLRVTIRPSLFLPKTP